MISEFCAEKIPNSGMTHLTVSKFDQKLHFTVGRLKWLENEYFYPKRKYFKFVSLNWSNFYFNLIFGQYFTWA